MPDTSALRTCHRRQADLHADAEEATRRVRKAAPSVAQAASRPLVRSDLPSAANHAEPVDGADGGLRQRRRATVKLGRS